ncbi:MAG: TetR/AcrR family transcriptional regulator [Muribaculaceae bacterium]|nr:TetR/AcrR family transcriptional regulator [Muribaculaceae bacterium]MEE1022774.1 TetR/AcrR family transcriptional regulator [Muribaculaceae bacterium]
MEANIEIFDTIIRMITENGLKSLTMDRVAATLGMSKRTLYEIFGSKACMIQQTLAHYHREHIKRCDAIFAHSDNVMEGILSVYRHMRNIIAKLHTDFFRDMDEAFADVKHQYEDFEDKRHKHFLEMFQRGIAEGVFRPDVNFLVQSKMLHVQMEALKRMEELFPKDLTLVDVYDSIIIGFLRSIASPKGMEILDRIRHADSEG